MADVAATPFGVTTLPPNPAGTPVTRFTVRAGRFTMDLVDYGARVAAVSMPDRHGRVGPVAQHQPSLDAYEDPARNQYLGDTVGRFANRIAGARFRVGESEFTLEANDGRNHLHGGPSGFGRRVWAATPFVDGDTAGVEFRRTSPHLEAGYPGTLVATSRTSLSDDGVLTFRYEATTDRTTIVGFTNHTYWNLAGTGTVHDHRLSVRADRYLPVGADGIPTADAPRQVAGHHDLRTPRRVGDVIDGLVADGGSGLDHCYLADAPTTGDEPVAVLTESGTGRILRLWTDQPGLQCYTGQHLAPSGHPPFGGICLEAQRLPDAPNRPDFPTAILEPGDVYRATTVIRLGVDD